MALAVVTLRPKGNAVNSHHTPQPRTSADKNTDNPKLSRKRRRNVIENDEYAAFTRRIVKAYGRRVATGDIEALTAMVTLADDVETAIRNAVIGLRNHGYSWTEIANRLGVTRQAARQRWNEGPH